MSKPFHVQLFATALIVAVLCPLAHGARQKTPSKEEIANMTTAERRALGYWAFADDPEPAPSAQKKAPEPSAALLEDGLDSLTTAERRALGPAAGRAHTQVQRIPQNRRPPMERAPESSLPAREPTQDELDNMTTAERRLYEAQGTFVDYKKSPTPAMDAQHKAGAPVVQDADELDNLTTEQRRLKDQELSLAAAQNRQNTQEAAPPPQRKAAPKPAHAPPAEPACEDISRKALFQALGLTATLLFALWLGAARIIKKSQAQRANPFDA